MNLLALTGAILTASANVVSGNFKNPNVKNKMMDVVGKYQSNEVHTIDDLVVGNIYALHYNDEFDQSENIGLYHIIKINDFSISGGNPSADFDLGDFSLNSLILMFGASDVTISYGLSNNDFYGDLGCIWSGNIEFYVDLIFQYTEDDYFDNIGNFSNFVSYTDYNEYVPSTSHRGNLYYTIYDFFYGIFDTSDTNELSMTIMGQNMNLTSWLAHSVTILLLVLGVIWLIFIIRWIFRVFSGLIHV